MITAPEIGSTSDSQLSKFQRGPVAFEDGATVWQRHTSFTFEKSCDVHHAVDHVLLGNSSDLQQL